MVEGTEPDFEDWYLNEHPRLVASLLLVTGDVELARDAVDEACVRALIRWPRVARMASPGGYVYRIALHEAWRRARRAALERRLLARRRVEAIVPAPVGEAWWIVPGSNELTRTDLGGARPPLRIQIIGP